MKINQVWYLGNSKEIIKNMKDLERKLFVGEIFPFPVYVQTHQVSSGVSVDHSIRIDHWYHYYEIFFSLFFILITLNIWRADSNSLVPATLRPQQTNLKSQKDVVFLLWKSISLLRGFPSHSKLSDFHRKFHLFSRILKICELEHKI